MISAALVPDRDELWSLREDTHLVEDPTGSMALHSRWGVLNLPGLCEVGQSVLRMMSMGPVSLANVLDGVDAADRRRVRRLLGDLAHLTVRSLRLPGTDRLLLSVVPIARSVTFEPELVETTRVFCLSRFAVLRREQAEAVLESPLSAHRVVLHAPDLLLGVMSAMFGRNQIDAEIAEPTRRKILIYLAAAGVLDDQDASSAGWSPYDLMFHSRSRPGNHDLPFGATLPGLEVGLPPPAVRGPLPGPRFPLPQPNADCAGSDKLGLAEIGELLYRTARVRGLHPPDHHGYQEADRAYPSMTGTHELELYLTLEGCAGIEDGAYGYDAVDHCLVRLAPTGPALVEQAMASTASPSWMLITITARIARLTWRYSGMAYATVLKHVGMLQHLISQVADTLGLGSRALAIGDSEGAATVFGLDWLKEPSVGEILVTPTAKLDY